MATPEQYLLKGPMPDLKKASKESMREECEMWRRVWQWVPDEVKYYVARTGTLCGITMRNYKRHLGALLETHWDIKEIELGVEDKMYDTRDGSYYFERKIIRVGLGGIIGIEWIAERKLEEEFIGKPEEEAEEAEVPGSEDQ